MSVKLVFMVLCIILDILSIISLFIVVTLGYKHLKTNETIAKRFKLLFLVSHIVCGIWLVLASIYIINYFNNNILFINLGIIITPITSLIGFTFIFSISLIAYLRLIDSFKNTIYQIKKSINIILIILLILLYLGYISFIIIGNFILYNLYLINKIFYVIILGLTLIDYCLLNIILLYLFVKNLYNLLLNQKENNIKNIVINDRQSALIKICVKHISISFTGLFAAFIIGLIWGNSVNFKYKIEITGTSLLFGILIGIWCNFCFYNFGENVYQIAFKFCDTFFMNCMVSIVKNSIKKQIEIESQISYSSQQIKSIEMNP